MAGLIGVGDDSRVSRQIDPPDPEEGSLTGAVEEGYFSFCNHTRSEVWPFIHPIRLGVGEDELD